MATYTIKYACGHSTHDVWLRGTEKEIKSQIEWYEDTIVCPECYKKLKQSEQYRARVVDEALSGRECIAITKGDTYSIKEQLKEHGFFWGKYYKDNNVLTLTTYKAWMINMPNDDNKLDELLSYLSALGVPEADIETIKQTKANKKLDDLLDDPFDE